MFVGDDVEVFGPNKEYFTQTIDKMWDKNGKEIEVAPHPQERIKMKMAMPVEPLDMIRKPRKE